MRHNFIFIMIATISSLFLGCSLQTELPPMAKYNMEVKLPKTTAYQGLLHEKVVRIAQVESSAMLSGRMIVYRSDNGQSYTYTKARWMESVNRQFSSLMLRALTKSDIFKDVIEYRSKAKNDYLLETSIYDFSQVIHDNGDSEVHLMVKVRLLEQYSRKIVDTRTFEYSEKGLAGDVQGAIKGYTLLMERYLEAVDTWLRSIK